MGEIAQNKLPSVERCFRAGFTAHDAATKLEIDLEGVRKIYDELRGEPSNECRVLMKAGAWVVPPEDRPKGWETMGLSEPMTAPERPPYALRELPVPSANRKLTVDLGSTSEPESLDETDENIDPALQSEPVKQPEVSPAPDEIKPVKWAPIRQLVAPLGIGESVIVPIPQGFTATKIRSNLSSILNAWKETQSFKWSVSKISEAELRVTKRGEHRSLVSDLVRDRSTEKADFQALAREAIAPRPIVPAPAQVAPPVSLPPPLVTAIGEAANECRDLIKILDGKMEKIKQLRDLLEDPYIASIFMSVVRDSRGSGDSL